jgi:hypothetical protein
MLGFRTSSPLGWIVALALFFLPWVDISCHPRDGRTAIEVTASGAQLAWGGGTGKAEGQPTRSVFVDLSKLRERPQGPFAAVLLTAYLVGLGIGIGFALTRPPGARRARIACGMAAVLFGLLLGGCWVALRDPVRPGRSSEVFREWRVECRYTVWYYGSYLANLWALGGFAVEYRRSRRSQEVGHPMPLRSEHA